MTIQRNELLNKLIAAKGNDFVKILTGLRRCGKSFLLFHLFKQHLLDAGIPENHIIEIDLESRAYQNLRTPNALGAYIDSRLIHDGIHNYVLIDEIQLCQREWNQAIDPARIHPDERDWGYITFYSILSQLRTMPDADVYVTGSNSRLIETDVSTEFRGRGQIIRVTPLSFSEFSQLAQRDANPFLTLNDYFTFGGLPECALMPTAAEKEAYLKGLFKAIYLRDIIERYKIQNPILLEHVVNFALSTIACPTNPNKLANAIKTETGLTATQPTVAKYLSALEESFVLAHAQRFDIRGRHYLDYPMKYYAVDTGLRNAAINFRQNEETHLMENVIFNELVRRGYSVDVGVIELDKRRDGRHTTPKYEIDFVVNRGSSRIYIQSAYMIPDAEKRAQETFSLRHTGDSFKKLVITNNPIQPRQYDDNGIFFMGLWDFLTNPKALEAF